MAMPRFRIVWAAAVAAGLVGVYVKVVRPWANRWGATDEEVARELPGDAIVPGAGYRATRAITIHAAPEDVWPWLVQMGSGRAGWYAYDRLDNGGKPSAREVVPWLQDLRVGDLVPMSTSREVGPRVVEIQPFRRMLWATGDEFTWEWVLEPAGEGTTRLVSRIHEAYPPVVSARMLYAIVASTGDVLMARRQLRGIRIRAEGLARGRAEVSAAAEPASLGRAS